MLKRVLALAVRAPSGDNLQPWRVALQGDALVIFNVPPERFYTDWAGAVISCGALIENLLCAARAEGFMGTVSYEPGSVQGVLARIRFVKSGVPDPFAATLIRTRRTDRGPYARQPLTREERHALEEALVPFGQGISLITIEDRRAMRRIARALGVNARLFLEDPTFHRYFFTHLRWNQREEELLRDGIPVRELGLNPFERFELSLMRNFGFARFMTRLGATRLAADAYTKKYLRSGAFLVITAPSTEGRELARGGQALEALWLVATRLGLGIQPIAGFMFGQGSTPTGFTMLAPMHQMLVERAMHEVRGACGLAEEAVIMIVRIGKVRSRENRTLRKPLSYGA